MASPRVLLIGNCSVDEVWQLPHYPREDEELRARSRTQRLGGNACNSAQILARLGIDNALISKLGDDVLSEWVQAELDRLGIDHAPCVRQPGHAMPRSAIWISDDNGSRSIVHYRDLPELTLAELEAIDITPFNWVHVEGRNIDTLHQFLPALDRRDISVSLEIEKPRPGIEQLCAHADIVVVSQHYLSASDLSAEDCLAMLKDINRRAAIVCTLGRDGLVATDRCGARLAIDAVPVKRVVDSVGAGDCFIAGLVAASVLEQDFDRALRFANRLAASTIQHRGMLFDPQERHALHL